MMIEAVFFPFKISIFNQRFWVKQIKVSCLTAKFENTGSCIHWYFRNLLSFFIFFIVNMKTKHRQKIYCVFYLIDLASFGTWTCFPVLSKDIGKFFSGEQLIVSWSISNIKQIVIVWNTQLCIISVRTGPFIEVKRVHEYFTIQ